VKLYTVIAIPKGATHAPIVLTRTPYDAASRMKVAESPYCRPGHGGDDVWVEAGFIRVFQDVRGKYGSEGAYVMTPRPPARSILRPQRHHRCLGHHRLGGEKRSESNARWHDRLFL